MKTCLPVKRGIPRNRAKGGQRQPDRPCSRAPATAQASSRYPSPYPAPGGLPTFQEYAGPARNVRHSGNPAVGHVHPPRPSRHAVPYMRDALRWAELHLPPAMPVLARCGKPARPSVQRPGGDMHRQGLQDGWKKSYRFMAYRPQQVCHLVQPASMSVRKTARYRSGWYGAARIAAHPRQCPCRCAAYRGDRTGWSHPAATAWYAGSRNETGHGKTARPTC